MTVSGKDQFFVEYVGPVHSRGALVRSTRRLPARREEW